MEYKKGQTCYIQRYNAAPDDEGRKAIIVSTDEFNEGERVVVCYFSRTAFDCPPIGDSYAIPQPVTISKGRITATRAKAAPDEFKRLEDAIRAVLGL